MGCARDRRVHAVVACEIAEFETAEAAWVNEAQLAAAGQGEARVGVRGDWCVGSGDEETAGHAEVDYPLGRGPLGSRFLRGGLRRRLASALFLRRGGKAEVADDVLTDALDAEDGAALEALHLYGWRVFEWFAMRAEPGVEDAIAPHAGIDTTGDGFHLREFGHRLILRRCAHLARIEESNPMWLWRFDCLKPELVRDDRRTWTIGADSDSTRRRFASQAVEHAS